MIVLNIKISQPLDSIPRLMDLCRRHDLKLQELSFRECDLTIIPDTGKNGRIQGFAERVKVTTPVLRRVSILASNRSQDNLDV